MAVRDFLRRALAFAPYTLPLWLFGTIPFISHNDVVRLTLYLAAVFVIPLTMDLVGGRGPAQPDDEPKIEYRLVPLLMFVKLLLVQALVMRTITRKPFDVLDLIILGLVVGFFYGALLFATAHELAHRTGRIDRAMAVLLLTTVSYPHYAIEHVHGHHLTVATPADPATSRLGESLWAFLPRSMWGEWTHAWKLEDERLRRRGQGRWRNRMILYSALVAGWYALAFAIAGWGGVIVVAVQSGVAIFTLEMVNYVQHYGLIRREIAPGRYERIGVEHSWNWETRFSSFLLLNLGRHSEHHVSAARHYETLRAHDGQPETPVGVMGVYLLALVPPLWFAVMDPRVHALRRAHGFEPAAADPPPETARARRRRRLDGFVNARGGLFILLVLAVLAATNDPLGFHGAVAVVIGIGLAALLAREAYLRWPERPA